VTKVKDKQTEHHRISLTIMSRDFRLEELFLFLSTLILTF